MGDASRMSFAGTASSVKTAMSERMIRIWGRAQPTNERGIANRPMEGERPREPFAGRPSASTAALTPGPVDPSVQECISLVRSTDPAVREAARPPPVCSQCHARWLAVPVPRSSSSARSPLS